MAIVTMRRAELLVNGLIYTDESFVH